MDVLVISLTFLALVVFAVLTLAITGRQGENRRRRFLATFGEAAPKKGACPEELGLLRDIARKVVAAHLEAAGLARISRQETHHLETVWMLAANERRSLRLADEATKLARSFGLVPRLAKTPAAFANMDI